MNLLKSAKTDTISKAIFNALEQQIDAESKKIIGRHKKQIADEIEAMRANVVAATAIRIARYTQVEQMSDRLVLTVEYKGDKA